MTETQEALTAALLKELRAAIQKYDALMIATGSDLTARRELVAGQLFTVLGELSPYTIDDDEQCSTLQ